MAVVVPAVEWLEKYILRPVAMSACQLREYNRTLEGEYVQSSNNSLFTPSDDWVQVADEYSDALKAAAHTIGTHNPRSGSL